MARKKKATKTTKTALTQPGGVLHVDPEDEGEPGEPPQAETAASLKAKVKLLEAELSELKLVVAHIDPEKVDGLLHPKVRHYTANVCRMVMAFANLGMGEDEWIAQLGLSLDEWERWKQRHPLLKKAVDRGRIARKAWWKKAGRRAILRSNKQFPMTLYNSIVKQEQELEDARRAAESPDQNASKLVKVVKGFSRRPSTPEEIEAALAKEG